MPEYTTKKISAFVEANVTPFLNGFLDLIDDGMNKKLRFSQLRTDILTDAELAGECTVPTPNPGDNSQRIANTEWVQDELGSLGLNPATADDYGTVRTNSTDAVPTVYLKSEVDTLLNAINALNTAQTNDISVLDGRIDAYDALNVGSRLTNVESTNTTQNTRLTSVEGVNTTQNTRLTTAESSLSTLTTSVNALMQQRGHVQGIWTGMTIAAAADTNIFPTGGTAIAPTTDIQGWSSPNFGSATALSCPVAGTYEVTYTMQLSAFPSAVSKLEVGIYKALAASQSTFSRQDYISSGFLSGATFVGPYSATGSVILGLAVGDILRMGIVSTASSGNFSVGYVRIYLRRLA